MSNGEQLMASIALKCRVPELSDSDLIITIGDPVLDTEAPYGDYYCPVQIETIDNPCRIYGVDAEEASNSARDFIILRFEGRSVLDTDLKPIDLAKMLCSS
jgi:hypothetical protein